MSHCEPGGVAVETRPRVAGKVSTVALIGPPNSGKSTLFNRLTGLRQKVANYPRRDRGTALRTHGRHPAP